MIQRSRLFSARFVKNRAFLGALAKYLNAIADLLVSEWDGTPSFFECV
jgi:hypothetical protein